MRKFKILLTLILFAQIGFAQDIIYKKDGTILLTEITDYSPKLISYYLTADPERFKRNILTEEVSRIVYNNEKEMTDIERIKQNILGKESSRISYLDEKEIDFSLDYNLFHLEILQNSLTWGTGVGGSGNFGLNLQYAFKTVKDRFALKASTGISINNEFLYGVSLKYYFRYGREFRAKYKNVNNHSYMGIEFGKFSNLGTNLILEYFDSQDDDNDNPDDPPDDILTINKTTKGIALLFGWEYNWSDQVGSYIEFGPSQDLFGTKKFSIITNFGFYFLIHK
jgi:hypothetical protein